MMLLVDVIVFLACVVYVASKLRTIADWIVERTL